MRTYGSNNAFDTQHPPGTLQVDILFHYGDGRTDSDRFWYRDESPAVDFLAARKHWGIPDGRKRYAEIKISEEATGRDVTKKLLKIAESTTAIQDASLPWEIVSYERSYENRPRHDWSRPFM
ncbi:MAG: hypothetical protein JXC85_04345 [Candidatus Aenigmarchaeota archaeon]|nr:hypothetical protein [Candidatus Aenigmarchaeota archaeon]